MPATKKLIKKKPAVVKQPAEIRDFPKFKKKRNWTAIFEYRRGVSKVQVYQKLGFSCEGGFKEASIEAARIAGSLSRSLSVSLDEMKQKFCRVVALYEASAFKDWENEVGVKKLKSQSTEHIREAAKLVAKSFADLENKKPIAKTVKVK